MIAVTVSVNRIEGLLGGRFAQAERVRRIIESITMFPDGYRKYVAILSHGVI